MPNASAGTRGRNFLGILRLGHPRAKLCEDRLVNQLHWLCTLQVPRVGCGARVQIVKWHCRQLLLDNLVVLVEVPVVLGMHAILHQHWQPLTGQARTATQGYPGGQSASAPEPLTERTEL
eukprot:282984-Rhodomonas_salina.2